MAVTTSWPGAAQLARLAKSYRPDDDTQRRRPRREAVSLGGHRGGDDAPADLRLSQGELRPGLVHGGRQVRPRRRVRDEHGERPAAWADHGVPGAARGLPG